MLNSYGKGSPHQGRNLNDTRNTSILKPEITSTPLNSPNKGRTASSLVTPNRKFLGPRRYALSTNGTLSPLKVIKDPPGPLLTSANFNVNVSTYIDTKSPGYAGRLVQYNEENSRNQQHTHQEKYGSPGLFPIVHLFKKNIPVISPKPKKPTVRIGTPELKNQYSQEHNRLLLEGIVRSNSVIKHHNLSNEVSTRSVLDALKEISRKRIHASEDYEATDESNKKLRRDCLNGDGDSSKRNRVDSPTLDTSISPPARQATKKLCTIDAILASKTSSMYANYDTGTKRKTIDDTKTKISPVNKRKFNNAETQTFCTPTSTNEEEIVHTKQPELDKKQEATSTEDIPDQEEIAHPPKQILKVFDDKPLEVIRKNRLGALLSALTGHEIPPIPMEDRRKALDQEWPPQSSEKKLTSILSPQNKLSKSVEKHVTFKLPETSNSQTNDSVSLQEKNSDSAEKNSTDEIKIDPPSQMSTPENSSTTNDSVESTSQTKFNDKNNSINNIQKLSDKNGVEQSTGGLKFESPPVSKWSSPIGGFKFDLTKPNTFSPKNSIDNTSATLSSKNSEPKSENSNINFARASVEATTSSTLFSKFEAASSKPTKSSPLSLKASLETNSLLKSSPISSTTTNALGLPLSLPNSSITQPLGQITSIAPFTFNTSLSTANSTSANLLEKKSDVSKTNNISSTFASPFIPGSSGVTTSLTFGTTVSYSAANSSKVSVGIAKTTSSPAYSSTANNNSTFVGTSIMSSTSNTIIPASTSGKSEIFGAISSAPSTSSGLSTSAVGNSGSTNLFSAMSTVPPSSSVTFSVPSFGTAISSSGFNVSSGNSLPSYNNMPLTSSFPSSSAANVLGVSPVVLKLQHRLFPHQH
ncbi:hypothetical protein HHI36_006320 [Cryptolaemus montrouzieri]|uniref:Uncharacterized protein n=1 Tax=Cryptolaemus montrouzieri TaxID=559131 RepID=A0ABD2NWQ5_9CUCU